MSEVTQRQHRRTATSLRRKIWIAFVLQGAAISFAAIVGVYVSSLVLKHVLIDRALTEEVAHFWKRLDKDANAPPPDTFNMRSFLFPIDREPEDLPAYLRGLSPGYHDLPPIKGGALIKVDDQNGQRMILLFKQEQVDALAFWFGMVPLALVLAMVYVFAWATYRSSRRAVSPIIWLANQVQSWDPEKPDISRISPKNLPNDVQGESLALASALHGFASRIDAFVHRERNFTRDASHELRTPLTVIRLATDMLDAEASMSDFGRKSIDRIASASHDMESLIECFLLLARADEKPDIGEPLLMSELVDDLIDQSKPLLDGKSVEIERRIIVDFRVNAPNRVVGIVLGNLIRNALSYTDQGRVSIGVDDGVVVVDDTGIGMDEQESTRMFEPFYRGSDRSRLGQGLGMSIVKRLCERYDWKIEVDSALGKGTRVSIGFR